MQPGQGASRLFKFDGTMNLLERERERESLDFSSTVQEAVNTAFCETCLRLYCCVKQL